TATTQPSRVPLRICCQARPSALTGVPIVSTAVPSASVVMTGALVDGPVRMFAPAPSVATITNPASAGADGDGEGDGEPDPGDNGVASAIGDGPAVGGPAAESVGGTPTSDVPGGRPSTPTCAPSSGRSTGGRAPQAPSSTATPIDIAMTRTFITPLR